MHHNKKHSDEHLNAFIDNQLDTKEKAEILDAVRHDADLSQRVCKLQKIQNLIQLSYESIETPKHYQNKKHKTNNLKWIAAASFLLAIGSITGWVSNQSLNKNNFSNFAQISQYKPASSSISESWKVMLHVSTDDPIRLNVILDETEALLSEYTNSSNKLELEILTNNKGMTLITDNGESYSERLRTLQNKYQNLALVACGETLKRMSTTHKNLPLLPKTKIVSSALNEIVKRKKQNWTYIKI